MKIRYAEELTVSQSIESFREDHPHAVILSVNDKECIGCCEGCGKPIAIGDKYQQWMECITCEDCSGPEVKLTTACNYLKEEL